MNCGFSNNCCSNNNYYCGNDCDCATPYEDNNCDVLDSVCGRTGRNNGGNCGILLFIIIIVLIFCNCGE